MPTRGPWSSRIGLACERQPGPQDKMPGHAIFGRDDISDPLPRGVLCAVQSVVTLQVHPELRRSTDVLGEAKCGICRNPTPC